MSAFTGFFLIPNMFYKYDIYFTEQDCNSSSAKYFSQNNINLSVDYF